MMDVEYPRQAGAEAINDVRSFPPVLGAIVEPEQMLSGPEIDMLQGYLRNLVQRYPVPLRKRLRSSVSQYKPGTYLETSLPLKPLELPPFPPSISTKIPLR